MVTFFMRFEGKLKPDEANKNNFIFFYPTMGLNIPITYVHIKTST